MPPRRSLARRLRWPAVSVVVVAAAVLVVGFSTNWFMTYTLDQAALQRGVHSMLSQRYGIPHVERVDCPADIEIVAGTTFACTATVAGDDVTITCEINTDEGVYTVNRPLII